MTIISILGKVRAPSRLLVRKGLVGEARRPRLVGPEPAHLRSHQPHEHRDGHELEVAPFRGHAPLGSAGHELIDEVAGGQSDERRHSGRKQVLHWSILLQGAVFYGTLPQKSAGFWNSDDTDIIAYSHLEVKSSWANRKSPKIWAFSGVSYWIKNFSSPQFKTWFAPMFFPGSFAVLSGAASPPAFLAGVVPRRRRGGFALIQVSCTRKEIASQSSPPRGARRLARIVFSAQNGIRDFV